jgi:hypothetical protein
VDKIIVTGQHLEIHLAVPVSGNCPLTSKETTSCHRPRRTASSSWRAAGTTSSGCARSGSKKRTLASPLACSSIPRRVCAT